MAKYLVFLNITAIFLFSGCSTSALYINNREWNKALEGVEDVYGIKNGNLTLKERQKMADSLEVESRTLAVSKKGYVVTFTNESPRTIRVFVKKAGLKNYYSPPVKNPEIVPANSVITDTLMPCEYGYVATFETYSGNYTRTYHFSTASVYDSRVKAFTHGDIAFRAVSRYGFSRNKHSP